MTDFGLAKQLDPHAEREEYIRQSTPRAPREDLTQTGAVMGTPSYMAPEQAYGDTTRHEGTRNYPDEANRFNQAAADC